MANVRWAGTSGAGTSGAGTSGAGTSGGGIAASVTVLVASMVGLPAAAAGAAVGGVPTCMGEPATIVGEPGIDLEGTDGPDVIVGGPGTQRINPGGGVDLVCAGDGHDGVFDHDHALDQVRLGPSRFGDVFVSYGADARAVVEIGEGGGSLFYHGAGVSVDLGAGTDSRGNQFAGGFFASVSGTPHVDVITGSQRAEELRGEGGADVIRGRGGDDYVWTALHADCRHPQSLARLYGGAGDDTVFNPLACRSRLSGGRGADSLSGHRGDNLMLGDAGNDVLYSGRGADRLRGGRGDDLLRVERGTVLVSGGSGFDRWVNWRQVSQNTHHTVVDIGAGTFVDRVVTRDGTEIVTDGRIVGIERFRGRISHERFIGSSGVDRINAGGTRGDKVDRIRGLGGDDRLVAPRHGWIDGGAGRDYCRAEQKANCER